MADHHRAAARVAAQVGQRSAPGIDAAAGIFRVNGANGEVAQPLGDRMAGIGEGDGRVVLILVRRRGIHRHDGVDVGEDAVGSARRSTDLVNQPTGADHATTGFHPLPQGAGDSGREGRINRVVAHDHHVIVTQFSKGIDAARADVAGDKVVVDRGIAVTQRIIELVGDAIAVTAVEHRDTNRAPTGTSDGQRSQHLVARRDGLAADQFQTENLAASSDQAVVAGRIARDSERIDAAVARQEIHDRLMHVAGIAAAQRITHAAVGIPQFQHQVGALRIGVVARHEGGGFARREGHRVPVLVAAGQVAAHGGAAGAGGDEGAVERLSAGGAVVGERRQRLAFLGGIEQGLQRISGRAGGAADVDVPDSGDVDRYVLQQPALCAARGAAGNAVGIDDVEFQRAAADARQRPGSQSLAEVERERVVVAVAARVERTAGLAGMDQRAGGFHGAQRQCGIAAAIDAEIQYPVVAVGVAGVAVERVAEQVAHGRGAALQGQAVIAFGEVGEVGRNGVAGRGIDQAARIDAGPGNALGQHHVLAAQANQSIRIGQVFADAENQHQGAGFQHRVLGDALRDDGRQSAVVSEAGVVGGQALAADAIDAACTQGIAVHAVAAVEAAEIKACGAPVEQCQAAGALVGGAVEGQAQVVRRQAGQQHGVGEGQVDVGGEGGQLRICGEAGGDHAEVADAGARDPQTVFADPRFRGQAHAIAAAGDIVVSQLEVAAIQIDAGIRHQQRTSGVIEKHVGNQRVGRLQIARRVVERGRRGDHHAASGVCVEKVFVRLGLEVDHRVQFGRTHAVQRTEVQGRQFRRLGQCAGLIGVLRGEVHDDPGFAGLQGQVVAVVKIIVAAAAGRDRAVGVRAGDDVQHGGVAAAVVVVADDPLVGMGEHRVAAGGGYQVGAAVRAQVGVQLDVDRRRTGAGVAEDFQEARPALVAGDVDLARDVDAADGLVADADFPAAVFRRAGAEPVKPLITSAVDAEGQVQAAVIGIGSPVVDVAIAHDVPEIAAGVVEIDSQVDRGPARGAAARLRRQRTQHLAGAADVLQRAGRHGLFQRRVAGDHQVVEAAGIAADAGVVDRPIGIRGQAVDGQVAGGVGHRQRQPFRGVPEFQGQTGVLCGQGDAGGTARVEREAVPVGRRVSELVFDDVARGDAVRVGDVVPGPAFIVGIPGILQVVLAAAGVVGLPGTEVVEGECLASDPGPAAAGLGGTFGLIAAQPTAGQCGPAEAVADPAVFLGRGERQQMPGDAGIAACRGVVACGFPGEVGAGVDRLVVMAVAVISIATAVLQPRQAHAGHGQAIAAGLGGQAAGIEVLRVAGRIVVGAAPRFALQRGVEQGSQAVVARAGATHFDSVAAGCADAQRIEAHALAGAPAADADGMASAVEEFQFQREPQRTRRRHQAQGLAGIQVQRVGIGLAVWSDRILGFGDKQRGAGGRQGCEGQRRRRCGIDIELEVEIVGVVVALARGQREARPTVQRRAAQAAEGFGPAEQREGIGTFGEIVEGEREPVGCRVIGEAVDVHRVPGEIVPNRDVFAAQDCRIQVLAEVDVQRDRTGGEAGAAVEGVAGAVMDGHDIGPAVAVEIEAVCPVDVLDVADRGQRVIENLQGVVPAAGEQAGQAEAHSVAVEHGEAGGGADIARGVDQAQVVGTQAGEQHRGGKGDIDMAGEVGRAHHAVEGTGDDPERRVVLAGAKDAQQIIAAGAILAADPHRVGGVRIGVKTQPGVAAIPAIAVGHQHIAVGVVQRQFRVERVDRLELAAARRRRVELDPVSAPHRQGIEVFTGAGPGRRLFQQPVGVAGLQRGDRVEVRHAQVDAAAETAVADHHHIAALAAIVGAPQHRGAGIDAVTRVFGPSREREAVDALGDGMAGVEHVDPGRRGIGADVAVITNGLHRQNRVEIGLRCDRAVGAGSEPDAPAGTDHAATGLDPLPQRRRQAGQARNNCIGPVTQHHDVVVGQFAQAVDIRSGDQGGIEIEVTVVVELRHHGVGRGCIAALVAQHGDAGRRVGGETGQHVGFPCVPVGHRIDQGLHRDRVEAEAGATGDDQVVVVERGAADADVAGHVRAGDEVLDGGFDTAADATIQGQQVAGGIVKFQRHAAGVLGIQRQRGAEAFVQREGIPVGFERAGADGLDLADGIGAIATGRVDAQVARADRVGEIDRGVVFRVSGRRAESVHAPDIAGAGADVEQPSPGEAVQRPVDGIVVVVVDAEQQIGNRGGGSQIEGEHQAVAAFLIVPVDAAVARPIGAFVRRHAIGQQIEAVVIVGIGQPAGGGARHRKQRLGGEADVVPIAVVEIERVVVILELDAEIGAQADAGCGRRRVQVHRVEIPALVLRPQLHHRMPGGAIGADRHAVGVEVPLENAGEGLNGVVAAAFVETQGGLAHARQVHVPDRLMQHRVVALDGILHRLHAQVAGTLMARAVEALAVERGFALRGGLAVERPLAADRVLEILRQHDAGRGGADGSVHRATAGVGVRQADEAFLDVLGMLAIVVVSARKQIPVVGRIQQHADLVAAAALQAGRPDRVGAVPLRRRGVEACSHTRFRGLAARYPVAPGTENLDPSTESAVDREQADAQGLPGVKVEGVFVAVPVALEGTGGHGVVDQ